MTESKAIDWDLARTIAAKVNRKEREIEGEERARMDADFEEFTEQAEELVAAETGLRSLDGRARGRVADRADWVDANLRSFQRLLKPMLEKMEEEMDGPFSAVGPKVAGAELGMMLGWMSTRVLGHHGRHEAKKVIAHPRHAGELGPVGDFVECEPKPKVALGKSEATFERRDV